MPMPSRCSAISQTLTAYKREPVAERVKEITAGAGVDAVIDMDFWSTAPLLPHGLLKPHGRFVCYGSNQRGDLSVAPCSGARTISCSF